MVLQDAHLRPGDRGWRVYPQRGLRIKEAAAGFVRYMENESNCHSWTREEYDKAGQRLWSFFEAKGKGRSRSWHCDIVFKIFNDLDTCFFNMELCRRVYLRWVQYPSDTEMLAVTEPPSRSCRRVRITLYYATLCGGQPPLFHVLGCLIHEMLHAYLMIMTLGQDQEYNMYSQPCYHGPSFVKCATVLDRIYKGRIEMLDGQEEAEGHYPGWNHPGKVWHPGSMFGGTLYPEDFHHLGAMRYSSAMWEGLSNPY